MRYQTNNITAVRLHRTATLDETLTRYKTHIWYFFGVYVIVQVYRQISKRDETNKQRMDFVKPFRSMGPPANADSHAEPL